MSRVKKVIATKLLNFAQKQINKLYAKEGPSDYVIDKQVTLNKKRHELNIPDKNELVFEDFVQ